MTTTPEQPKTLRELVGYLAARKKEGFEEVSRTVGTFPRDMDGKYLGKRIESFYEKIVGDITWRMNGVVCDFEPEDRYGEEVVINRGDYEEVVLKDGLFTYTIRINSPDRVVEGVRIATSPRSESCSYGEAGVEGLPKHSHLSYDELRITPTKGQIYSICDQEAINEMRRFAEPINEYEIEEGNAFPGQTLPTDIARGLYLNGVRQAREAVKAIGLQGLVDQDMRRYIEEVDQYVNGHIQNGGEVSKLKLEIPGFEWPEDKPSYRFSMPYLSVEPVATNESDQNEAVIASVVAVAKP